MPSTVYKGDIAEVSFAPETGLVIRGVTDATMALSHSDDITTITFSSEQNTTLFEAAPSNKLRYPKNILVGSQVIWEKGSSNAVVDADLPNSGSGGKVFTIVENSGTTIKITPKMTTGAVTLGAGNNLHILPYKTPPIDVASSEAATGAGNGGTESCKIDQFLGVASAITLPETKVDLKRYHVVGLGRDTSIQVPGKMITEGGSFEVNMHTARWLKYCLGNELLEIANNDTISSGVQLDGAVGVGASVIKLNKKAGMAVGDFVEIRDEAASVPIVSDHEPDGGDWTGAFDNAVFDKAMPHETRRIIGISENDNTIYLDEPLKYPHADTTAVKVRRYNNSNSINISSNTITNPATHLLFSRSTLPSFCLEVSQRRRDLDSDVSTTDGLVGDTKELTRVYRGCKVTDFSMTTDNDAALRLSVNFNSALCYTDTGRLESTPLTRYGAHRMFDDTANTDATRLESGIGVGTQKPFMFYNGSIQLGGIQVAQVFSFTLNGTTGMVGHHTIAGSSQAADSNATDQVPFAGSRNVSLMVEGQTTYDMTIEIAVDDPVFFHKMRTGTEFSTNADGTGANRVLIEFEKNLIGSTMAGASEKMLLIVDDFYIVEAPIQIPEDKGIVKSTLRIMPKAIKVIARDTLHKY
jgi:hypothetical protein|tara:strand:+ start:283 stop:2196 length:1914 start_codon:yes stop_codon:yes gene_type:complete